MTSITAMSFYHEALTSAIKSGKEGFSNKDWVKISFLHEQEMMRLETRLASGPSRAFTNHALYAWF